MYEQSVEMDAFFQGKSFFETTLLKITFKHHLSVMSLMYETALPISSIIPKDSPHFP